MADHVIVNNQEVKLDATNLKFDETNLSAYLEHEASYYDYFGKMLSELEYELQQVELSYETKYAELFAELKDAGGSDKLVEAKVESHIDIVEFKKKIIDAKRQVKLVQQHLRAWDKSHDNAQSRGHMLRKEMEKLGTDIRWRQDPKIDECIKDIIEQAK